MFFIINLFSSYSDFFSKNANLIAEFCINSENQNDIKNISSNIENTKDEEESNWYLEIPTIELKANIADGTTKEVMDKFIGHFKESKRLAGNVCLAAHNRGYENNYFSNIKKLKEGDTIIYYYQNSRKEYVVKKHYIIKDTDLSCLEDTEENTITLITCIENEEHYRRCVKAIEKQK